MRINNLVPLCYDKKTGIVKEELSKKHDYKTIWKDTLWVIKKDKNNNYCFINEDGISVDINEETSKYFYVRS